MAIKKNEKNIDTFIESVNAYTNIIRDIDNNIKKFSEKSNPELRGLKRVRTKIRALVVREIKTEIKYYDNVDNYRMIKRINPEILSIAGSSFVLQLLKLSNLRDTQPAEKDGFDRITIYTLIQYLDVKKTTKISHGYHNLKLIIDFIKCNDYENDEKMKIIYEEAKKEVFKYNMKKNG